MTTLVARPPLQLLSMSAMQSGSRRLSARLQEKEKAHTENDGIQNGGVISKMVVKGSASGSSNNKKRKNEYDEDDDGFTFSRVKKNKKPRQSQPDANPTVPVPTARTTTMQPVQDLELSKISKENTPPRKRDVEPEEAEITKKRRKKMSFSTPKANDAQPVRRSKRISNESRPRHDSPTMASTSKPIKSKRKDAQPLQEDVDDKAQNTTAQEQTGSVVSQAKEIEVEAEIMSGSNHSATKIALPFADTPVIRRNKAMREGKGVKGERRSSLGFRGRRASSLIETGNSNALPHQEVEVVDFYKHIESDLMEPRRMRQLLTWCATRAMHAKPKGTDFEDASAKSAARVIEEELLKELANKSELSDWFSREDVSEPPRALPERPNPKNMQNLQRIFELEEQINRLKLEKDSLQALLKPPEIPDMTTVSEQNMSLQALDKTLLSTDDEALIEVLNTSSRLPKDVSRRINNISSNIGQSIDQFADSIQRMEQYRTATDNIAGRILTICADKLAERERAGRRRALQIEEDRSPGRDLSSVLRGLSKAE